jgi:PRTRC genetic system protein C
VLGRISPWSDNGRDSLLWQLSPFSIALETRLHQSRRIIERNVMQVNRLEREFLYNGVKLPDTTPTMSPEQVRDTYTHLYPEIATAAIEGPETVAGKLVYKFVRAIGAKG